MKKFLLLVFLFFFSSNFFSEDIKKINLKAVSIFLDAYDFHIDEVEQKLLEEIQARPEQPLPYFYLSYLKLWSYASDKKQEDFVTLIDYSEKALEKLKIFEQSNEATVYFYIGMTLGIRGFARLIRSDNLKAFWEIKNSKSYLQDALKLNPKLVDSELILGLYEYSFAFAPGVYKWALYLFGFQTNQEEAIKKIKNAFQKGKYLKNEAAFYLSLIYINSEFNPNEAEKHIKYLLKKFPNNPIFSYVYAIYLMKNNNSQKASSVLEKILEKECDNFLQLYAYSYFLLGDCYFKLGEYLKAIENYSAFLDKTKEKSYSNIAYYRTALCYKFLGDEKNFESNLKKISDVAVENSEDLYAARKAENYLKENISDIELELIKTDNLISSGKYSEAIETLIAIENDVIHSDQKAILHLYKAIAFCFLEDYENCENEALKVFNFEVKNERWTYPFACYYLAYSYKKMNNIEEYEKYIKKALSYSDYDFFEILTPKINGLKRIK